MGWWTLWGGLMMVLFWGAIIGLVFWALQSVTGRRVDQPTDAGSAERSPLDIARERYARGEIGRDEFARISKDLMEERERA
jgi:putative membrane protein